MARNWKAPRAKVDSEDGCCRVCGKYGAEAAHIWPRSSGGTEAHDNILPLCRDHHSRFDGHTFDVLPYLTVEEVLKCVELAAASSGLNGLELARMRLCPSDYKPVIEDARQLAAIDEASAPSPAYGRAA